MLKIIPALLLLVALIPALCQAADTPQAQQQTQSQPQQQKTQQQQEAAFTNFMFMLGVNTAIMNMPNGTKIGVIAKNHMVQVTAIKDNFYFIKTTGWINIMGSTNQKLPYSLVLGKKTDVYANPGDKKEMATMWVGVTVTIVEENSSYARINIEGWLPKPGTETQAQTQKKKQQDDLVDKANTVLDIIDNREMHPEDSLSR
jgi:hypothetical protein